MTPTSPPTENTVPTINGLPIQDLGVLPQVVAQINELAADPTTTGDQVAELIITDPTLTSKILRILNSSFYGLRQEIRSLRHAVAYLGIHQVRNIIMSSALVESFRFDHGIVEPRAVWEHSLGCAIGAKRVGDAVAALDGDGAYLGGLLHDLGRIIFLSKFPDHYGDVVGSCERGLCSLRDAERSRFGLSHEAAGEMLGRAWGFSDPVLAIIRHHHDPQAAGELAPQVAVVGFVDAICHQQGMGFAFDADGDRISGEKEASWQVLLATLPGVARFPLETLEGEIVESLAETRKLVADLFG